MDRPIFTLLITTFVVWWATAFTGTHRHAGRERVTWNSLHLVQADPFSHGWATPRAGPVPASAGCEAVDPEWSPEGEWIAFASDCAGNLDLYRVRPTDLHLSG